MTRLQNGQTFPAFDVSTVGGGTIIIPRSLQGSYGAVLIYRGAWCPYCQAQLAGFQRASEKLAEVGIKVVAFSVDDEATTARDDRKVQAVLPGGA
jgi:peroxiredoxin